MSDGMGAGLTGFYGFSKALGRCGEKTEVERCFAPGCHIKAENARHGAAIGSSQRRHFELSAGGVHLTSTTLACARGKLEREACLSLTISSHLQPAVDLFSLLFV